MADGGWSEYSIDVLDVLFGNLVTWCGVRTCLEAR